MKAVLFVVLLALFATLALARRPVTFESDDCAEKFAAFQDRFGKLYGSDAERTERLGIFCANLARVARMNHEHGSEVFGVSKFMDLTPEEFADFYLMKDYQPAQLNQAPEPLEIEITQALPTTVDWRNVTDVITPVKNQEQCGSCWAFSATEAIESAWVQAGNSQQILGPQQIVDCDTNDGGCNGGNTETAYQYVIKAGGQETEKQYPYTAKNGNCKFNKADVVVSIKSWHYVSQAASTEMTKMLSYVATTGPVSVCVDAAPWQYYTGGVLKVCGQSVDHCVQVTGYGQEQGLDVWYVRNSWGADWGESGYIWVEQGKNLCAIAGDVTVPVV